jgi:hypothetical protein
VVEITAIMENAAVSKRKAGDETSHARLTIIHERLRLITARRATVIGSRDAPRLSDTDPYGNCRNSV